MMSRRMRREVLKAVTARFLYSEFFEFPPTFKIFLATNHRPAIRGTDYAMWRRVWLIPFEVQISEAEQDRHLGQKVKASELPGVLNWLLEGCLAWQKEGLRPPQGIILSATADYRAEQDVLGRFLEEACEASLAAITLGKDLYAAYTCWCNDTGEPPVTLREFNGRLDERGSFARDKGERGVRWHGLTVRPAYLPLRRVVAMGERDELTRLARFAGLSPDSSHGGLPRKRISFVRSVSSLVRMSTGSPTSRPPR